MNIQYPTRGSAFTPPCRQVLGDNLDALKEGETVAIAFDEAAGGYPGDIVVEIDASNTEGFKTDWQNADPTRFPARIRGAVAGDPGCGRRGGDCGCGLLADDIRGFLAARLQFLLRII